MKRFTEKQKVIHSMKLAGVSGREIGRRLDISEAAVRGHIRRIKAKDGAAALGYDDAQELGFNDAGPLPPRTVEIQETIEVEVEHNLKTTNKSLKAETEELKKQLAEARNSLSIAEKIQPQKVKPLKIKGRKKGHVVTAGAFLSDTHFDEVINLSQSGGVNEYNREIAEKRLEKFAEKVIITSFDLMKGFSIEHLDLPFGGDIVSGNIHEELANSNEAEIMDTVIHWSGKLGQVVITLAKEFPSIYIPCVVGNHGRNSRKPRHKGRARDNFDWLIYRQVLKTVEAAGVKNVTFDISDSTDVLWQRYDKGWCLTHGDQASGGQGWGGIFSPIMRLQDKKSRSYAARGQFFDYLIMGHWHQFFDCGSVLVNGALKGFDEFAHNLNFTPQPPQQAFWLTAPEKGKIVSCPLFVG